MRIITNSQYYRIKRIKLVKKVTNELNIIPQRKSSNKIRDSRKHLFDSYKESKAKSIKTRQATAEVVLSKLKTIVENKNK